MAESDQRRPGTYFSSGISPDRKSALFSVEHVSGYSPSLERFINGRKAFQDRHTALAHEALGDDRPTDAIIAVRKVLEVPDMRGRYDTVTVERTLERMRPGILNQFQEEVEAEVAEIRQEPSLDIDMKDLTEGYLQGSTLKELVMFSKKIMGRGDKANQMAFDTDFTRARELREIETHARAAIEDAPRMWRETAEKARSEYREHDVGVAQWEEAKAHIADGDLDEGTNALSFSYIELQKAKSRLSPDSDEDLVAMAEVTAQTYNLLTVTVDAYKVKPIRERDLPHLETLAKRLIARGYPPPNRSFFGIDHSQERYLDQLITVANLGNVNSPRGHYKRFFRNLEAEARHTNHIQSLLNDGHMVAMSGTDRLDDALRR